jgi:hypothetical protein
MPGGHQRVQRQQARSRRPVRGHRGSAAAPGTGTRSRGCHRPALDVVVRSRRATSAVIAAFISRRPSSAVKSR